MEWIKRYYWVLIVGVFLAGGGFWYLSQPKSDVTHDVATAEATFPKAGPASNQKGAISSGKSSDHAAKNQTVVVDIKGAVVHPGLYHLKSEDRINDLIQRAGGFRPEADQTQINLAQKVQDQGMVYVPQKGEPRVAGASNTANAPSSSTTGAKINLNTATKEELQQIDGVGEKKAEKIIDFRTNQGQFSSVTDLKKVNGFGDKTVQKLSDKLTV
ncbi:helix-hairpin-helix domain-containing protein [Agrilactobacillus fermenti]|uniref:ComEA family DNA-binding protein n=1 Tax=Agrilactobacillus fermenti TaxID=2586909 RepID=UPI001E3E5942|nr:ComEA family DNA-binding protein [Agrilactobacillus fermenti]MCD2255260.1 helix-hairpin-helix domain-containing protein [Agrilactobacillus fermenti]